MSFTSLPINKKRISQLNDSEKALLSAYMGFTDPDTGKIITSLFPDPVIAELRTGTKDELDNAIPPLLGNEPAWESDTNSLRVGSSVVGGGLASSENYWYISPEDDLVEKYTEAKFHQPNGSPLSEDNRLTIVLLPGVYTAESDITFDTNFIDIVGLLGKDHTSIRMGYFPDPIRIFSILATDVLVEGVSILQRTNAGAIVAGIPLVTGVTKESGSPIVIPEGQPIPPDGVIIRFTVASGDNSIDLEKRYVPIFNRSARTMTIQHEGSPVTLPEVTSIVTITDASFVIEYNPTQRIKHCFFEGPIRDLAHTGVNSRISGHYESCDIFSFQSRWISGKFIHCNARFTERCSGWFIDCEGTFGITANEYGLLGAITTTGVFLRCKGDIAENALWGNVYDGYFLEFNGSRNSFSGQNSGEMRGTFIRCNGGFIGAVTTGKLLYCSSTGHALDGSWGEFLGVMLVSGLGKITYCVDGVGAPINTP